MRMILIQIVFYKLQLVINVFKLIMPSDDFCWQGGCPLWWVPVLERRASGQVDIQWQVDRHSRGAGESDQFSQRTWRRNLHIWSPNYASMLALHKLRKWLHFGYVIVTGMIRSSFLMRSYFWHGRRVQKVRRPAYDMCASSLAIAALVLAQT